MNILSELERILNPQQLEAVTTLEGPILVIAGAGSGKTRVIEYRVLYLVSKGIPASNILLLTFTRRAAFQMLSRSAKHNPKCRNVEGGTFHSFALKIIKKYASYIGLSRSFTVLDESDAEEVIQRCAQKFKFYEQTKRFPTKETLRKIISLSINKDLPVESILLKEYPHFADYSRDIEKLKKEYQRYKLDKSYLDYDDLLIYLKKLLEKKQVLDEISYKYKFIMVDEYQDTNKLQGQITYLLGKKHKNIMVVGDDAQSIYGFRGATHENIMEFPKRFPDCKVITLEHNYRSTQSILDLSNSLLDNMRNKYPKCLVSAKGKIGRRPKLLYFKDPYKEAEWIADKIKALRDKGIKLSQQAVLFRSAHISIPLQAELSKRNIPYQVFGGIKFYETAHVKDLLAHLKVLINPKDELSWNRIFLLIEGIGQRTAEKIISEIEKSSSFKEIIQRISKNYITKGKKYAQGLEKLIHTLELTFNPKLSSSEKIKIISEYYQPIFENKFDDWHIREGDLKTLESMAKNYSNLEEFLSDLAIEPPERGISEVKPRPPEDEKPLCLSTIHSAKGLEWDVVFIIGLIEGVMPISYALDDEDDLQEEERLLYVAVTRAKEELFLSVPYESLDSQGYYFNKISRFINLPNILSRLDSDIPLLVPKEDEEVIFDGL